MVIDKTKTRIIIITLVLTAACLLLYSSMSRPVEHDEGMYCVTGALLAEGKLPYSDFAYVSQLPYHPLICAAIYRIFQTTHYLLLTRLFSVLCDVGTVALIVSFYCRAFGNNRSAVLFAGYSAVILLFNTFTNYSNGLAWNHDCIVVAVMLALWCFTNSRISPYRQVIIAAGLLTIAMFMRATTAAIWLIFLLLACFKPELPLKVRLKLSTLYLASSLIFALWPLYVMLQSPQATYIDLVLIPSLNGAFLHKIGMAHDRLNLIMYALGRPDHLLLILFALVLWVYSWVRRRNDRSMVDTTAAILVTAGFAFVAIIPPTMWLQYFAPPVPFLLVSLAWPLARICGGQTAGAKTVKIVFAVIALSAAAYDPMGFKKIEFKPLAQWTPVVYHNTARAICEQAGPTATILTLSPLVALEGGSQIYTELAAGPFAYRVADFLTNEQRMTSKTIGPHSLDHLIQTNPPQAILVGTEPEFLEEQLHKAAGADFKRKTFMLGGDALLLYYR